MIVFYRCGKRPPALILMRQARNLKHLSHNPRFGQLPGVFGIICVSGFCVSRQKINNYPTPRSSNGRGFCIDKSKPLC